MTIEQRERQINDYYVMTTKHKFTENGKLRDEVKKAIEAVQDYNIEQALDEVLTKLEHEIKVGIPKKEKHNRNKQFWERKTDLVERLALYRIF